VRRRAWLLLALALGGARAGAQDAPAGTDAPAPAEDAELTKLLAEWDTRAAALADVTLPFTQERRLALRPDRATTARGTFQMRRDPATGRRALRWHFLAPRERIEVLRGTEVRTYEPYLEKARQVVEVRDLAAFGLDPTKLDVLGQTATQLRAAYAITRVVPPADAPDPEGTVRLRLVPRDAVVRKRVAELELLVERRRALPQDVVIRGPIQQAADGTERRSVTRYRFDLARAACNQGLPEALFTLAPPGVPERRA
jgi:hypothetical protein